MKKLLIIMFLLISVGAYSQRTDDFNTSRGRIIFYKGIASDAQIYFDTTNITIDEVVYAIIDIKENDGYFTFLCMTDDKTRWLITWSVRHKNILLQKLETIKGDEQNN